MTRHSLDCPTALIIFKITHHDRAGETGTVTLRYGEIVTMDHDGEAVIAAEDGSIIRCPVDALHPVDERTAALLPNGRTDFVAAQELVRFIPAMDGVHFTARWLMAAEANGVLETEGG